MAYKVKKQHVIDKTKVQHTNNLRHGWQRKMIDFGEPISYIVLRSQSKANATEINAETHY
jgi:hypothetical protein